MARPSRSRSGSSDSGAKCSSGVAFAKATILTRIALDARFPNKSESAFGVEAGFESSSESPRIAYCDRPYSTEGRNILRLRECGAQQRMFLERVNQGLLVELQFQLTVPLNVSEEAIKE